MPDPLARFHRIICTFCGHESYSGDVYHHVTREVLIPQGCMECEQKLWGPGDCTIICPPGCVALKVESLPRRTAWDRILEED